VVIFDLLEVTDGLMDALRNTTSLVSLSPIFSHMDKVDFLFHRTKYHNHPFTPKTRLYKGLSYALIQEGCRRIPADLFKIQLCEDKMSIAISMGGADAANQTLKVIRKINQLKEDYVVWVMIGEGYKHSYDELIEESKKSHHEIILAKTNSSMWKVLSLTSLLILPGGITTYEAAYAGLPTINIVKNRKQRFLIQELLENNLCDEVSDISSADLVKKIDYYYNNREDLVKMHSNSKGSIDGLGAHRICKILKKEALQ
jgi:spore coat polysaccharide biosynthesis predicted glycosyltransferase SpsG